MMHKGGTVSLFTRRMRLMKRRLFLAGAIALGLTAWISHASAAVTYVDVTPGAGGNTTLTDGSQWDPLTADQGASGDGLWAQRAFGNGATIFQNAASGNSDNAHRLRTTISGLAPGSPYNVYVYFWSDVSQWRINAGLGDIQVLDLPQFSAVGGHADPATANTTRLGPGTSDNLAAPVFSAVPGQFTTAVMIGEGNRRLYQAYLGIGTADAGGTIRVMVDDDPPVMADSNQRTWYDGVGYELIPEPATSALAGLALMGLAFSRRCRAA
jgi:hypothetical protein